MTEYARLTLQDTKEYQLRHNDVEPSKTKRMDLLLPAEKLCTGFEVHIEKTEHIECLCVEDRISKPIQDLKRDLIKNKEIAEQIVQEVKKSVEPLNPKRKKELEEKIKDLEEKITKQDDKIKDLETRFAATQIVLATTQTELDTLKNSLQTGQLSFNFEKDLATYIYPEGKKIGSRKIFTTMKKWLEDKRGTHQGDEANKKWDDLKKEFSWSDEHEKVFFKLLEYRRKFAHPARNAAELQIPDDFTDDEKRCIKTINDMIERVNELMG